MVRFAKGVALICCCWVSSAANAGLPEPVESYFQSRKLIAQDHTLARLAERPGYIYSQLVRLERNAGPLDIDAFNSVFEKLAARRDTSDFQMVPLIRMVYQYWDSPLLTEELKAQITSTILNFKYWIDEPGTDPMVYWSENHEVLFHTAGYLAGQRFPNEIFANSGLTGVELQQKSKALLEKWMWLRAKTGFAEWHSNNYYEEDIGPLLNIVDFAEDEILVHNARNLVDLLLLDIALYSHGGVFGGSHGRTFESKLINPDSGEATRATANLVFGQGNFNRTGGVSFSPLAVTTDYVPNPAVLLIGRQDWWSESVPRVWNDRSQMGFAPDEADELGLTTDPDDLASTVHWWAAGGYAQPEIVNSTFQAAETYGLFDEGDFFPIFAIARPLWKLGIADELMEYFPPLNAFAEAVSLGKTNTYVHHKPVGMLSVAQDKSKGNPSFQNQTWGAVMDGNINILTTHPLFDFDNGGNPNYFTGAASLPRIAQHEDIALIIYNPRIKLFHWLAPTSRITHAYFPTERFDEIVGDELETSNWFFARKGDGYVALYSANPASINEEGRFAQQEIVAPGSNNLWIFELGWKDEDGTFQQFIQRIRGQQLVYDAEDGHQVQYHSDQGLLSFSWDGDFTVDAQTMSLSEYPRYSNPFMNVDWGQMNMSLSIDGVASDITFLFDQELN